MKATTKKAVKKSNKTIVNFILDKSGSMSSVQDATISGFNEYINTLRKDKKGEYELTLTLFDTKVTHPISKKPLKNVFTMGRSDYNPDGMTALYDAVCKTIKGVNEQQSQKVLTIIMTDGMENASSEYNQNDMRTLIKQREDLGNWTFVYLGANQDSYVIAQQYGIKRGNTANFNATQAGLATTMGTMASNTAMFSASADANTRNFLSEKDQNELGNTK